MNSYPPELLVQLAPVMFVAGLDVDQINLDDSETRPQEQFTGLVQRLRETLTSLRKVSIWQPERDKTFQVVLVNKTVRFPPRKITVQDDPSQSSRSPLSPLTPTSPIYPDGLIAPIWIRKHTTLVPSVFVYFLRLYESPQNIPQSPLDLPEFNKEKDKEKQERLMDTDLSAEISERKKSTNERNIKLTVVLLASRKMLDDPSLDTRLTYIRRQSGLDSRAALFVLSPVSQPELNDFVQSLQQALYDPAIEYYSAHSKRVRRKRNRHNHSHIHAPSISAIANPSSASVSSTSSQSHPSGLHTPSSLVGGTAFLRPEGWTVRYEYKLASFAEFRGENEIALKHYHDSYSAVLYMLSSTAILPPRTKRWAEAKVLADCISVKICKLYLYNSEHALALSQHNLHMRRFADLSRGWGIGEETFEFWSWMARQYRLFAELLEHGLKSTLEIPKHLPVTKPILVQSSSAPSVARSLASAIQQQTVGTARSLGINPSNALQHPGYYYLMAAECTDKRRAKFSELLEDEQSKVSAMQLPGFTNEMSLDHFSLILELYTKSYELFKKYAPSHQTQNRLTLQIAYKIAQTYHKSGKVDLAMKFFERISKTYRYERWRSVLQPLLSIWYACARQMGDVELSVRLLIEMICCGYERTVDMEDGETVVDDMMAILKSTVPSSPDKIIIVDIPDGEPFLNSNLIFWTSDVYTGEPVAFQVHLSARTDAYSLSSIPIRYLRICVGNDEVDGGGELWITIQLSALNGSEDKAGQEEASSSLRGPLSVTHINLGTILLHSLFSKGNKSHEVNGDLNWSKGNMVVLSGSFMSRRALQNITLSKAVLGIEENGWHIEIPFEIGNNPTDPVRFPTWLETVEPPHFIALRRNILSANIRMPPHRIHLTFLHDNPAYVGEHYPITLQITSEEVGADREFEVIVDFLLQPGEDDSVNRIIVDTEESAGLIKGISLGRLKPGDTVNKTLYLIPVGNAGDRILDVSVQTRFSLPSETDASSPFNDVVILPAQEDFNDTLETLIIPVVNPFKVSYDTTYYRKSGKLRSLADLGTYEKEYWDDSVGGEASVQTSFNFVGSWDIVVKSLQLARKTTRAKVTHTFLDGQDNSMEWKNGDIFNDVCRISISVENGPDEDLDDIPGPGYYEICWSRSKSSETSKSSDPITQTIIPLPPLRPPREGLIALVRVSPFAFLHEPEKLELVIRNHHPSRSAHPIISLELNPTESFVVSGIRSARLPILLPGMEESIVWSLIPIECGPKLAIPKIKVLDRRNVDASEKGLSGPNAKPEIEGTEIEVADISWARTGAAVSAEPTAAEAKGVTKEGRRITISVQPRS